MNSFPETWTVRQLIDCTRNKQVSYGIVQPGKHVDDGIPIIRVNNFNGGSIDTTELLKVEKSISDKHKKTLLRGGEVLLTIVGTTGQTAIVPDELCGFNVARAVAVIDPLEEVGPLWIDIFLQSDQAKYFLNVRANTTVQKTLNLKDVRELPVPFPPEPIKKRIENIYLAINSKIKTNLKLNKTLECMTQAIFKSWFVDFDPVHAKKLALEKGLTSTQAERAAMAIISGVCGPSEFAEKIEEMDKKLSAKLSKMSREKQAELAHTASLFPSEFEDSELGQIPKGWEVSTVSDFGEVVTGKTPSTKQPEFYDGELPFVTPSDFDLYGMHGFYAKRTISDIGAEKFKNKILPSDSVLVTCIGSDMGKVTILKEPSITNQQINAVKLNDNIDSLFLYFYFKSLYDHLRLLASDGTTMPIINKGLFEKIKIMSPSKDIIRIFNNIANSMSDKILNAVKENIQLSKLRDTLLPRLLTGEIDLSKVKLGEDE